MGTSVYKINKGINKAIEFKGLKAQYIWYLGAGLIGLMILFAVLYILDVNSFVCVAVTVILGGWLFYYVYALSRKYGQYGMMKKGARRFMPRRVVSRSRKVFTKLNRKPGDGKGVE